MFKYFVAPCLLLWSVGAAQAAPVDGLCAQRFLSTLADPATALKASGFFNLPGAPGSGAAATQNALDAMMRKLGGVSRIEPLAAMPEGKTTRTAIGEPASGTPFVGSAFSAVSQTEGRVIFFVSQRMGYSCSISSLALHIP
ncbi:hypothetical protein [Duganella sp. LjRoot269]|jgi:hypothetical protein|uniref:hypothetical protein n=1 Tax=Duganella sp. LjRoot269 TaxID=3342305 RepID=UPI003ECC7F96